MKYKITQPYSNKAGNCILVIEVDASSEEEAVSEVKKCIWSDTNGKIIPITRPDITKV